MFQANKTEVMELAWFANHLNFGEHPKFRATKYAPTIHCGADVKQTAMDSGDKVIQVFIVGLNERIPYFKRDICPTIRSNSHGAIPFFMELKFPYILSKRRSELGKQIRRQYKNDKGVPYQLCKGYSLNLDGCANTITTFTTGNNITEMTDKHPDMEYHEHPTKEDLLEYFGQRIRVRKMTPRTALRLMDVDDADIDKMMNATETVTLKDGTAKTKKAISKTALYRLAGNSIVVSCLYHIFRTMFIPGQHENTIIQPNLFNRE